MIKKNRLIPLLFQNISIIGYLKIIALYLSNEAFSLLPQGFCRSKNCGR